MNSLDEFSIRTNGTEADRIEALYRTGSSDVVHAAGGGVGVGTPIRSTGCKGPILAWPSR